MQIQNFHWLGNFFAPIKQASKECTFTTEVTKNKKMKFASIINQ